MEEKVLKPAIDIQTMNGKFTASPQDSTGDVYMLALMLARMRKRGNCCLSLGSAGDVIG